MKRLVLAAAAAVCASSVAWGADLRDRPVKPTPPAAPSLACKETAALPPDVFGFTTGSDVGDLGSWGAALEYNGAFGTRFSRLAAGLGKAQVSYSPFLCFEIGPTVQFASVSAGRTTFALDARQFGGTVEMKYKLLGRATHGVGMTLVVEPGAFNRKYTSGFVDVFGNPFSPSGAVYSNLTRLLLDFEIVKDRLYGAVNLEHGAVWDDPVSQSLGFGLPSPGFVRSSSLSIRAALALKLADNFYLGVEGSHQRAYSGIFLNRELGHAWFAGPTFYWQVTDKLSLTGSYNYQFAGQTKDALAVIGASSKGVDLINFNRHTAKLKLGYSF